MNIANEKYIIMRILRQTLRNNNTVTFYALPLCISQIVFIAWPTGKFIFAFGLVLTHTCETISNLFFNRLRLFYEMVEEMIYVGAVIRRLLINVFFFIRCTKSCSFN